MRMVAAAALAVLVGCAGSKKDESVNPEDLRPYVERPTEDGLTLVEIDLNSDGRADVYNYYRERSQASRLLVKREVDLNWDSKIDVVSFYDDTGTLIREEMDGDFDGQVEWVDHYQGGRRVMSEVDTEFDGQYDLYKFYENDSVRRKERDTDGDGKIDYWEYFGDDGMIVKTGRDLDGDGQMDVRDDL
ncbi:MAG: hypothetical protein GY913_19760 [Proteobacteria bacterium]|nr:hypothetical protein [Pseudomonadota bacterium]MCP4919145.1 hypothetical protein [Pseudomonadota bacterium]